MNWKFVLERTFAYAVAISTTLIMLYGLIKIYLNGHIKFIEPNQLILLCEIAMLSLALILIFKIMTEFIIYASRR